MKKEGFYAEVGYELKSNRKMVNYTSDLFSESYQGLEEVIGEWKNKAVGKIWAKVVYQIYEVRVLE